MLKKIGAILFHAILTLLVFKIHVNEKVNSMLNDFKAELDQGYLNEVYLFHKTGQAAFMKRPITTFLIEKIHQFFSVEIGTSFVVLNFSCLFLSSLLLFYLSKQLTKSTLKAFLNSLLFFMCFPIIFMFFVPIYTYDEPLQLVFVFAALIAFFKQKNILFLFLFTMSVFVRESSLILIPALFVLKFPNVRLINVLGIVKNNFVQVLCLILPAILYFISIKFYVDFFGINQAEANENGIRWMCLLQNFESDQAIIESISAFFLVLLIPIYFLITSKSNELFSEKYSGLVKAFLVTLVINTFIAFFLTKVREARVIMLPLVFLWPIFSLVFSSKIKLIFEIKNWIQLVQKPLLFILLAGLIYWSFYFSFFNYKATIGFPKDHYFNNYLFVLLVIFSTHLCLYIASKQKKSSL